MIVGLTISTSKITVINFLKCNFNFSSAHFSLVKKLLPFILYLLGVGSQRYRL